MKWNFQGWPRKNNVKFPGASVFGLGISKGSNTILWNIYPGVEKFKGGFSKSIPSTLPSKFGFFPE